MRKQRLPTGFLAALLLAVTFTSVAPAAPILPTAAAAPNPCPYPLVRGNRPIAPSDAPAETASFTDPTAEVQTAQFVRVGEQVYIAPFARLEAQSREHGICIEHASNIQDNTLLKVNGGSIHVGEEAIVAHGGQMVGDGTAVSLAAHDACPLPHAGPDPSDPTSYDPHTPAPLTPAEKGRQALANALAQAGVTHAECDRIPAFVGFNALNQSHVEDGALLAVTSRLPRGVTLRAGYSSFPGKSLDTQAEADTPCGDPAACDVRYVNAGDISFMNAVIHVNECLARGYTAQYRDGAGTIHPFGGPESVEGIGIDPGSYHHCEYNDSSERPTIGYPPDTDLGVRDPALAIHDPDPDKKIRIIGDVRMVDIEKINDNVSIRADEGEPMTFRQEIEWGHANTFHALEVTPEDTQREVRVFDNVKIEERVVVHGGGRRVRAGGPDPEPTFVGAGVRIGKESVVFRSHVADNTIVGSRVVLAGYDNGCDPDGNCTPGEIIPDRCVKFIDTPAHECAYFVEW